MPTLKTITAEEFALTITDITEFNSLLLGLDFSLNSLTLATKGTIEAAAANAKHTKFLSAVSAGGAARERDRIGQFIQITRPGRIIRAHIIELGTQALYDEPGIVIDAGNRAIFFRGPATEVSGVANARLGDSPYLPHVQQLVEQYVGASPLTQLVLSELLVASRAALQAAKKMLVGRPATSAAISLELARNAYSETFNNSGGGGILKLLLRR